MKYLYTLLFFMLSSFILSAQGDIISVYPKRVDTLFQVDVANNFDDLVAEGTIQNNTGRTLHIKWKRRVLSIPKNWGTKICDENLCYVEIVESNIDEDLLLHEPVIIPPYGEANLDVHIEANGTVGTGKVEIELSLVGQEDDIIGVAEYHIEVRDLKRERYVNSRKSLQVYPNPSNNYLNVSKNELIDRIVIYNMVGREIKAFNVNPIGMYDISKLPNGIYLIGLFDEDGDIIKTTRITKRRSVTP